MDLLFAYQNWPFGAALVVLVVLGVIEGAGLVFGGSLSEIIDGIIPDNIDNALGFFHLGKVPFLVLIVLFLAGFSVAGYVIQGASHALLGIWLPAWIAVVPAWMVGLAATHSFGALLAKLNFKDETSAVSENSLLGRAGVIIAGHAQHGLAAQAKVKDETGRTHYLMVEPEDSNQVLEEGSSILIIRKIGGTYHCIANPHPEYLN